MKKIIVLAVATAALSVAPASYAVNKCVGPDGKVAYTDEPCSSSARKIEVKTVAPSTASTSP